MCWLGWSLCSFERYSMGAIFPIACTHASTRTTSLMHVKNSMHQLFMTLIFCNTGMKKMKEKSETSIWIVDHFSLTFVNLLLAWMLYYRMYDCRIRGKFWVWGKYYNQFCIYQMFLCISLKEPHKINLSNPEACSELCQISKMECFAKIVNG